jgi:hypothetical protein
MYLTIVTLYHLIINIFFKKIEKMNIIFYLCIDQYIAKRSAVIINLTSYTLS